MDGELVPGTDPGRAARDMAPVENESRVVKDRGQLGIPLPEGAEE